MTSATKLIMVWAERDHRYSTRRQMDVPIMISPDEEQSIREWRGYEVSQLPADDRVIARNVLGAWAPPKMYRR